jgi:hypothetical protein
VLVLYHVSNPELALIPLMTLLFPDGRLQSPRWRWPVGGYLTLALADVIVQAQMSVYASTHHRTQVDTGGQLLLSNGHNAYGAFFGIMALIFFASWIVAVGYQVVSWRRASGERRQQLSWLMAGGAAAPIFFLAAIAAGALPHGVRGAVSDVLVIGMAALPVSMGVAILKYRLYEIGRIVSRTVTYTIVTGLLVGVYAGLVLLTTRVLSVSSPVAVAASTLAAAAVFTPIRRRVQRTVDRRFNRARYDADRMVEAFAARLKRRGGPGNRPRRPGRGGEPGPGTRPCLGVDKSTRVMLGRQSCFLAASGVRQDSREMFPGRSMAFGLAKPASTRETNRSGTRTCSRSHKPPAIRAGRPPDLGLRMGAGDGNRTRTISLGIRQIGVPDLRDLGTRRTASDRDGPCDTGVNGPPMARGLTAPGAAGLGAGSTDWNCPYSRAACGR